MKQMIFIAYIFLSTGLSAQRLDTISPIYKIKPTAVQIKKHRAIGNGLSAAGFASLGVGILFAAKALHETTKDLIGLPVTVVNAYSDEKQEIGSKADRYFKASVAFLGVSIPLLIVGSVERRKVRLMLYSRQQHPVFAFKPATNAWGLGLGIGLGK